jgi:hypothetical protein
MNLKIRWIEEFVRVLNYLVLAISAAVRRQLSASNLEPNLQHLLITMLQQRRNFFPFVTHMTPNDSDGMSSNRADRCSGRWSIWSGADRFFSSLVTHMSFHKLIIHFSFATRPGTWLLVSTIQIQPLRAYGASVPSWTCGQCYWKAHRDVRQRLIAWTLWSSVLE